MGALWPTPVSNDDNKSIEAYTRMKKGMAGGERKTVTSLNVAIKAGLSISSPQAIPASHSQSPGSDWARKMTATYGRRLSDYWLSSDPPDSWVRTLMATSRWGSMLCYLTWKKSVTPHGRLLFRLVPSAPRTAGIGSGFWPTPNSSDNRDRGNFDNPAIQRRAAIGKQINLSMEVTNPARMWPTPRAIYGEHSGMSDPSHLTGQAGATGSQKLNSAWVSRMMGYPDDWLTLDGEEIR